LRTNIKYHGAIRVEGFNNDVKK